jgi:hypothetical protein
MDGTPRQDECTLKLAEALNGDLPNVCMLCGEATNLLPTELRYRGRRVRVRLPVCGSHRDRSRWESVPFVLFVIGTMLFALGVCLLVASLDVPRDEAWPVLALSTMGAIVLGLLTLAGSLAGYAVLVVRDISLGHFLGFGKPRLRVSRLSKDSVTLMVASEFAEALRVYRGMNVSPL